MRQGLMIVAMATLMVGAALPAAAGATPPLDLSIPQGSTTNLDVQQVLTELGFYRGPLDGRGNRELRAAILAFHKATGAVRSQRWTNEDWLRAAVYEPMVGSFDAVGRSLYAIDPLPERRSVSSFLEIDIANQIAYFVEGGTVRAVLGISSGSETYYRSPRGSLVKASTPRGTFTFYRRIDGLRHAPLGVLYRPWYFEGGYAVHGSPSVPAHPASHGCVRVTNWDADWLAEQLSLQMVVRIIDGAPFSDVALSAPPDVVLGLLSARLGAEPS